MKLIELKNWLKTLPEEFDDYEIVNVEETSIDAQYCYRLDKPITSLGVDEYNNEIYFLNKTIEDEKVDLNKLEEKIHESLNSEATKNIKDYLNKNNS